MEQSIQANQVSDSQVKYAGFGIRFLAYWVDFLILFPLGLMIQQMVGNNPFAIFQAQSLSDIQKIQGSANSLLGIGIALPLLLAYFLIFWVNYDGATPGKKLLGIKILKDNGEKLTYPAAFIRYIGYMISGATMFFFGIGYLWTIWDKKKQALHDKIAGTVVVKTDKQPRTAIAVLLTFLAFFILFGYMSLAMIKGISLGFKEAQQKKATTSAIQPQDIDKISTYAPTSCGISIPIPKTTDTLTGTTRKWIYEEVSLSPDSFTILDKDVFSRSNVQGAFVQYKPAEVRLEVDKSGKYNFGYTGFVVFCIENTKRVNLDEYKSLVLANKNMQVSYANAGKVENYGEVKFMALKTSQQINGQNVEAFALIGLADNGNKLFWLRTFTPEDPNSQQLAQDMDVMRRNLKYRSSQGGINIQNNSNVNSESNSKVNIEINNNGKSVNITP